MNRSIILAGFAFAGLFSTLGVQAAEATAPDAQAQMCREVTYREYARTNHGPAGKFVENVKVTKRTRIACNEAAGVKKPARTAAVMRHHKSA